MPHWSENGTFLCSAPAVVLLLFIVWTFRKWGGLPLSPVTVAANTTRTGLQENASDRKQNESIGFYKELYYKLHNLENYPEVLSQARSHLVFLLSRAALSIRQSHDKGIFSLNEYTPKALREHLWCRQEKTYCEWEQYLMHRKQGGQRQLFRDRKSAIHWLRQMAPLKYVDGAWLGHLNRVTTPFDFRHVVKNAWQILSEEYGDGDPEKHHAHVFQKLMREVAPDLPGADSVDFIQPCHGLDDVTAWMTAVAQLLISLFPHDFLPEILGYNLHFETVKLETLIAARELRELEIDPYYFTLHISIDNADSGHTAMALFVADQYLEQVYNLGGEQAKRLSWERMQMGFALSEYLEERVARHPTLTSIPTDIEAEVGSIFLAKSIAAGKVHCGCTAQFKGKRLVEWLDPALLSSATGRAEFLECLASSAYWVTKDRGGSSRLVKELSWGGRMFGSFTSSEVDTIKKWIDSLDRNQSQKSMLTSANGTPAHGHRRGDVLVDYPVFTLSDRGLDVGSRYLGLLPPSFVRISKAKLEGRPNLAKLLPLWFTHPCLVQSLIAVPFKSMSPARCSILRFLRAQAGFNVENSDVAGMDEARRINVFGILDIGLEILRNAGLTKPLHSVKDVLELWPSDFAITMLRMSMLPDKNAGLLIGVSWAFVDLHDVVASDNLLTKDSRDTLSGISHRERECLVACIDDLKCDSNVYPKICQGYRWGTDEIKSCFS